MGLFSNLSGAGGSGVDFITSEGSNANGHYRVWNSGLIEQWGEHVQGTTNIVTITLPIPFTSSVDYISAIDAADGSIHQNVDNITNACGRDGASLTTIKITSDAVTPVESTFWQVKGY